MVLSTTLAEIAQRFPHATTTEFRGQTRVEVPVTDLESFARWLRDQARFDLLVDITCVDYLHYRGAKHRFGLVYLFAQTETAARLTLRVYLDDDGATPTAPSLVPLWEGANWLEREVWDMFGIHFSGHPDLRRILLPEPFTAHPLRKDYPLQGRGERHNFSAIRRGEA